ncbi:unnamed protein product [Rotaria sp. Silwood2]|nr:unnamed protein product [Rotaria sp. Silwood2]
MTNIRNNEQSRVDIESAELLDADINVQMHPKSYYMPISVPSSIHNQFPNFVYGSHSSPPRSLLGQEKELSSLYVFSINQPFSIDGKTNHPLLISEDINGKAKRAYRLSSDRFLSRGNYIIRE